jgi:hypothetical protein
LPTFTEQNLSGAIFHSVWKPMLTGAVGAAIMAATVIGSVWVILPKISTREVVVDHVIQHDVPFDNHTPQDKPFDNYVPHPKPFDVPIPAPKPVAEAAPPTMGPDSPYAPKTPDERKFTQTPEYKTAEYHGRIVKSPNGRSLWFEDGKNFSPAHWDEHTGESTDDPDMAFDSEPFVGDLGMCVEERGHKNLWDCTAMHNGVVTPIGAQRKRQANQRADTPPVTDANGMINVDVVLDGYGGIVSAMVDTGCSFPLSITPTIADALLRNGGATRTQPMKTTLADGSTHGISVITIKTVSVDGRVLHDVDAGVGESEKAPILLGLGALNRLGPYTIGDGRIVFTGEPT